MRNHGAIFKNVWKFKDNKVKTKSVENHCCLSSEGSWYLKKRIYF